MREAGKNLRRWGRAHVDMPVAVLVGESDQQLRKTRLSYAKIESVELRPVEVSAVHSRCTDKGADLRTAIEP